jgi:hypothetical protein
MSISSRFRMEEWKTRLVERGFPDRSFDIESWQGQGDEAIFAAASGALESSDSAPVKAVSLQ